MTAQTSELTAIAAAILRQRYADAKCLFLAGSLIRGEGTSSSDLDLVVMFENLETAYRESFQHAGWPVEAFVHDPQTLRYFFEHVDRRDGIPSLPQMVVEGIEVPSQLEFGDEIRRLAQAVIDQGPPAWSQEEIDASRYGITNLIDDLKDPRSKAEALGSLAALYPLLATHYLRSRHLWGAKDKSVPRALRSSDPVFAERFSRAFEHAFASSDFSAIVELADDVLRQNGGRLFAGYYRAAPNDWRSGC